MSVSSKKKLSDSERAALDAALSRLGLNLPLEQKHLLLKHLALVLETNKKINLTSIRSFEEAIVLHIEDSLAVLPEFSQAKGRFCDLGTGGGFPGLPLGIVSRREGVLLDSVKKKAAAVGSFISELGLSGQLESCSYRSEELARLQPESFETVVIRAVSALPSLVELARPLLSLGGSLICLKGTESAEDLERAIEVADKVGMKLVSSREFTIGDSKIPRSAYVFICVVDSSVKLPRRPGMAQKRPLA